MAAFPTSASPPTGSSSISFALLMANWPSIGTLFRTKPPRLPRRAAPPCSATLFPTEEAPMPLSFLATAVISKPPCAAMNPTPPSFSSPDQLPADTTRSAASSTSSLRSRHRLKCGAANSLKARTVLPFVISTGAQRSGEICGFCSPELRSIPQQSCPLSSRPERSVVERSAVSVLLNSDPSHNSFVISTGAQRSGEIGGYFSPELRSIPQRSYPLSSRPERSAVERSAVSVLLNSDPYHNSPALCHLDRSAAQWRDLRFLFS